MSARRWLTHVARWVIRRTGDFAWEHSRVALLLTCDKGSYEVLDLDRPEHSFRASSLELALAHVKQIAGRDRR